MDVGLIKLELMNDMWSVCAFIISYNNISIED